MPKKTKIPGHFIISLIKSSENIKHLGKDFKAWQTLLGDNNTVVDKIQYFFTFGVTSEKRADK